MKIVKPIVFWPAALATTLCFNLPVVAQQQEQQQAQKQQQHGGEISLVAGHNVVDAVDDLRETVADLIGAVMEAEEGLALRDRENQNTKLQEMEQNLEQMETVLDRKAEASDSSWLNWFEDRDYSVTVKEQIGTLGDYLQRIASMLNGDNAASNLQVVVGHNLVDQVDDVRETTADLLSAVTNAGPQWGWFNDAERFNAFQTTLEQMEQTLDKKAEMTDTEWESFVASAEYRVTVHQQINQLAEVVSGLANRISTDARVSQVQ